MQPVLISIISINYNNFYGLKKTIESIKSLNFTNFEYIVIDGDSIDNSKDLILKSSIIDKFIIEKDSGIYDAMNKGARLASGRFIYFLNSGDIVLPDVFTELCQIKNIFDHDVIYGSTKSFSSESIDFSRDLNVIYYDIPFCHQSVLLNREVFMKFNFSNNYKLAADYHLFLNVFLSGHSFYRTNIIFSKIDITGVSHTRQLSVLSEYVNIFFDVHSFPKSCYVFLLFLVKKYRFILKLLIQNISKNH
jgi:putative colanic acid biosynthesis glycosyltransferase